VYVVFCVEKEEGAGGLNVWIETLQPDTRVAALQGTVSSSLEKSLRLQGRPGLAAAVRSIFASKPAFGHNNLKGAACRILYEEQWIDGEFIRTGKLLAVEITNTRHRLGAYRYTDSGGRSALFDERGRRLQRDGAFIEPCVYNRISGAFGYRIHPIRRSRHFHGGVDFAAPAGGGHRLRRLDRFVDRPAPRFPGHRERKAERSDGDPLEACTRTQPGRNGTSRTAGQDQRLPFTARRPHLQGGKQSGQADGDPVIPSCRQQGNYSS
jgi:hypothetical protein